MKIVVHDYGGYAFPVQLSRELARRGHRVLYLFARHMEPKGRLWKEPQDPAGLEIAPIEIGEPFAKYRFVKRRSQERAYGRMLVGRVAAFQPDIVFNTNCPIEPAAIFHRYCRSRRVAYVHWTQDIHSLAIRAVMTRKLPVFGELVARYYEAVERSLIGTSDATIIIADEFAQELKSLGIRPRRTYTIPNWMPLDEMAPVEKVNPWSVRHGLDQTTNITYVGTLSLKHDDEVYVQLARHFAARPDVRIVVIAAGIRFDRLVERKRAEKLDNLVLLGWQKYEDIAQVLGSADILLAAVTPEASAFSVPCKVLSSSSAGRPVLAAIPANNLVAQILVRHDMGFMIDPNDSASIVRAADTLIADPGLRAHFAQRGREYALKTFEIGGIANRFERLIDDVMNGRQEAASIRGVEPAPHRLAGGW